MRIRIKKRTPGAVLLFIAILAISHFVSRYGVDWGERTGPTQTEFAGPVVAVLDGDTIEVRHDGRKDRVRFNAVDCPEHGQAFGSRARELTSSLVRGLHVTVKSSSRDSYGRIVGDVVLPDGRSLNQELVKAGMAWWYRYYSNDRTLEKLEAEARSEKRGLWSDPHPIAPWEWRQQNKRSALP